LGKGGGAGEGVGVDDAAAHARAERLLAEGNALEDDGDVAAALGRYQWAAREWPDNPRVPLNVANALAKLGRVEEAIRTLELARAERPQHAPTAFNLGALYAKQVRNEDAEAAFRAALQIEPAMAEAAVALASLLDASGRTDEAVALRSRAVATRPDYAGARFNLGQLFYRLDRCDEAEAMLAGADPGAFAPGQLAAALGELFLKMGRHADAARAFTTAMQEDPFDVDAGSGLVFSLNFRSDLGPEHVFSEHVRIGALISRKAGPAYTSWEVPWIAERRLKIGYVSGDFIQHPVARFLLPVLARHDRGAFDIHCFSNHTDVDDVTRQLQRHALHWHVIAGDDDATVAQRVRALGIDILVDLSGHTARHRLGVFARRPAPVQATWLGYLNTTGVAAIDYRICDSQTDPERQTEHLNTERLVRLPHAQWCYLPFEGLPRPMSTARDETGDAQVVFGSFNQLVKVTDATLDLWCGVLRAIPRARLDIVDAGEHWAQRHLLPRFAARGVPGDRLRFLPREPLAAYFERVGRVDIALDTFPYNGATTTFDTLWMGTPVVALRGDRGIARGGYSILSQLGIEDLVAQSAEDYVLANVRLAADVSRRAVLRDTLRDRLRGSPLLDTGGFVRGLESAYRAMWKAHFAARS
jgi:predicted O-linked N-acetylglucosamine transferase (SPINDLY family)